MSLKYTSFVIPTLGTLCVAGAVALGVAIKAPYEPDIEIGDGSEYNTVVPDNLSPSANVPTMEQVIEKHLFSKDRKATGQNTFSDLVVKGVYVGTESSAIFSLKYKPTANVRVWKGDVDSVISQITNERDPRKPIVNFLSEWDIKEITFKGVTFEHLITGEVETYLVDYTPAKHVTDNSEAGYGQGLLAVTTTAKSTTKTSKTSSKTSSARSQGRAEAFGQMRSMMQRMTPEQRSAFAERMGGGGGRTSTGSTGSTRTSSSKKTSSSSGSSSGSSSRGSSRSR